MTEPERPPRASSEPMTGRRIDFAYTVYWMKTARGWDAERRKMIADRLALLLASPEFLNNAFERKFQIDGLDDLGHSGASLLALKKVLEAID